MTRPIDLNGFERKFEASDDPWNCRTSRSEAVKRKRSLTGLGLVASTLDVGCGDGAGTGVLAGRTLRLDACDEAKAALASARRLLGTDPRIRFHRCRAPHDLPRGRWHRIHVSELVYYLSQPEIVAFADALAFRLASGGKLIAVHHVISFPDARTRPAIAVAAFHRRLRLHLYTETVSRHGSYVIARMVAPGRNRSPRPSSQTKR